MKSEPFFTDEILRDIAGRCKFGASVPEEHIKNWKKAEPKPWTPPSHYMDEKAALFGISGYELALLETHAWQEIEKGENQLLRYYYKKFLLAAKISCGAAIEEMEKRDKQIQKQKEEQTRGFQGRLKQFEDKKRNYLKGWQDCRDSIRIRWGRIQRGLAKMLEKDASLDSKAERDIQFIRILESRGILKIRENRVVRVDWDRYQDTYIEDIWAILQELNDRPGGDFLAKED